MAIHFGVIWKLWRIIITLSNYYGNWITVIVTVIIHSNDSHQISNVLNVDERLVNSRPTHVSLLTSLNMIELASLNIVVDRLVHACWNCLFILLLSYNPACLIMLTELTSTFDQLSLSFDRCFWNQNSPRKYLIMQEKNQCSCTKIILDNHLAWKLI